MKGKNTIGIFTLIKNEAEYIGYCIMALLDHVDGFYYYDGNSTDGTIEIIEYIKKKYDKKNKIHLYKNKDCKNLKNDYVRLFNELIGKMEENIIFFCHPDMICINPQIFRTEIDSPDALRFSTKMISFAGDKNHIFDEGRVDRWACVYRNIHKLRYYGHYGTMNEDLYFTDITGDSYVFYKDVPYLPYKIKDTKIILYHYCDTKPYARRYGRMLTTMKNIAPYGNVETMENLVRTHPRVTLESGIWNKQKFLVRKTSLKLPDVFKKYGKEFNRFIK